ncbi:MAG: copper chaperone PCu(A)C [Paracoccus sp. (in: a-proteobacteria)]|nr:copper chaperone PCu(A)C [Paracoccus sp. (in: a-proteobacteria)]
MKPFLFIAALGAFAAPALASDDPGAMLAVSEAYARSANPASGAAFMLIANHGPQSCVLTEVRSDVAERVELHTHQEDAQGVMRMTEIEGGIEIAAGKEAVLERGGDHVMLLGLHAPLAQGDQFTATLDFGDCGEVELDLEVDNERTVSHGAQAGAHSH